MWYRQLNWILYYVNPLKENTPKIWMLNFQREKGRHIEKKRKRESETDRQTENMIEFRFEQQTV